MILDRLHVDHLRLFQSATLKFEPRLNLITGNNGAGKTTLLEAVHLLVRGRSFRRGGLDSLINYDQDRFQVQGRFSQGRAEIRVALSKSRADLVSMQLNGEKVTKVSDVATRVPIQTFTPDLAELVLGAPDLRRRWLDNGLAHSFPEALPAIGHYRHVLRQRNAALKKRNSSALEVWDFELAASGERLTDLRRRYFKELTSHMDYATQIMCPQISIQASLNTGFGEEEYRDFLVKQRPRDVKLGVTIGGPHRADVQINLGEDKAKKRSQASAALSVSRGQARSLAAALLLSQVLQLSALHRRSILLVDDLGSELDMNHTHLLLQLISDTHCQMLATTVNPESLPAEWFAQMAHQQIDMGQVA